MSAAIAPPTEASSLPNSEVDTIGRLFVKQYYTLLSTEPDKIHSLYEDRPAFVRGTEGETAVILDSKEAIRSTIAELQCKGCLVQVTQIDSQKTSNNGILVQVLGIMHYVDKDSQKFSQTFFLSSPGPKSYFVLNDIFRFMKVKNDTDDEEGVAEETLSEAPLEGDVACVTHDKLSGSDVETTESEENAVRYCKIAERVKEPVPNDASKEEPKRGKGHETPEPHTTAPTEPAAKADKAISPAKVNSAKPKKPRKGKEEGRATGAADSGLTDGARVFVDFKNVPADTNDRVTKAQLWKEFEETFGKVREVKKFKAGASIEFETLAHVQKALAAKTLKVGNVTVKIREYRDKPQPSHKNGGQHRRNKDTQRTPPMRTTHDVSVPLVT